MSNEEEIIAAADREINCLNEQIERLQEQLKEANEIILWHATTAGESNTDWCRDYVIKWGVK